MSISLKPRIGHTNLPRIQQQFAVFQGVLLFSCKLLNNVNIILKLVNHSLSFNQCLIFELFQKSASYNIVKIFYMNLKKTLLRS